MQTTDKSNFIRAEAELALEEVPSATFQDFVPVANASVNEGS